jgi:hypothetical protein
MIARGWASGAAGLAGIVLVAGARAEGQPVPVPAALASDAPTATPAPSASAPADRVSDVNLRPFGAGAAVSVTTPGIHQVSLYVGKAVDLLGRPSDYEFVKVGKTPITFELPPGNYWLEAESPDVTRGSLLVRMDREPKHLEVHTGSSGLGDMATLTLALGATAVLAATVILASGSSGKSSFDKGKVVIPLYIGGGVLLGSGIGLYFASRTSVMDPGPEKTAFRSWPEPLLGVTGRF